jgi:hypothetical protein
MKIEMRLTDSEQQLDDNNGIVRCSPGQSRRTKLRQAQQESRIDEVFQKLGKLFSDKTPVRGSDP